MKIEIPIEEWDEVRRRVAPFLDTDERHESGVVLLRSDGERRTWIASDSFALAALSGGRDAEEYELLVPERAILAATLLGRTERNAVHLVVADDDPRDLRISCGGAVLHAGVVAGRPQGLGAVLDEQLAHGRARAEIDRVEFTAAVHTAWQAPRAALNDGLEPLFNVGIGTGEVEIAVDWQDFGHTDLTVTARTSGSGVAAINPRLLVSLLDAAAGGTIGFALPDDLGVAVAVFDGDWTGLLMPIDTSVETLRPKVENLLVDVFGPAVTIRDHDGDYRLSTTGVPVYARLADGDPAVLQVFAIAIDGIEPTQDLLKEINDQNARTLLARVFEFGNQVLIEADLVASTIDPLEIEAAFRRVRHIANEMGPIMAIAHGGQPIPASEDLKWRAYLSTVVSAELEPGRATQLAGREAVEPWPFNGPVHAITAYNPNGRLAPDDANTEALADLARHLTLRGTGFVRAVGAAADGSHAEDSFLTWSLTTDEARRIGKRFGQDAVFEIDEPELRVVSCTDDEIRATPRRHRHPDELPQT